MRRYVMGLIGLSLTVLGAPQNVQADPVVLELYTSQGCSSCPPADAMFTKISKRDDVIALALHVDYWDYIGWADNLADPIFTNRQKAYAHSAGKRMIYTPQIIVGGEKRVVGNRPMDVVDQINAMAKLKSSVSLNLSRNGDHVKVVAKSTAPQAQELFVQMVRYIPSKTVNITRGENAGRTIEYSNIVTQWKKVALWDGLGTYEASLSAPGSEPVVVIIQNVGPARILAAAVVN